MSEDAFVWLPGDPEEETTDPAVLGGRLCRMVSGSPRRRCKNSATWALRRYIHGRGAVWYRYCSEHNYGRRIEAGRILKHYRVGAPAHGAALKRLETTK